MDGERPTHPTGTAIVVLIGAVAVVILLALVSTLAARS